MIRFTRYLAVAILITERLKTGWETVYFSTDLANFNKYFAKKNKYFIKIDKYEKNSFKTKKVENILKYFLENYRDYFS